MPKKKATTKRHAAKETDGKCRIELRVEQDLYDGITKLATQAGVSLNQLMSGLIEWSVDNGCSGELHRPHRESAVTWRKKPLTISLGRMAEFGPVPSYDSEGRIESVDEEGIVDSGIIYGILDFNPKIARRGD